MPMFPKVIRAGAGPHDLGPGDNRGDTFPESAVQHDPERTESGNGDLGRERGSATGDTGSRSSAVVGNPPYVRLLLSLSVSALSFTSRIMTCGMPSQITYLR